MSGLKRFRCCICRLPRHFEPVGPLRGTRLALALIQVLWVNSQGLFVLGPIVLTFGLIDAAVRPGSFVPGKTRWWRVVGLATALTGLACVAHPYGVRGALYPLQLAQTMGNPIFATTIAELTPSPGSSTRRGSPTSRCNCT